MAAREILEAADGKTFIADVGIAESQSKLESAAAKISKKSVKQRKNWDILTLAEGKGKLTPL